MGGASIVVIKTSGEDGQRYKFDSREWCTIGSHPECDIIVHSKGVAKLHALLLHSASKGAQVFGLDEALPTCCPSKKATLYKDEGAKLESGDLIVVGERKFRFEEEDCSSQAEGITEATNAINTGFALSRRRSSLVVRETTEIMRPCVSANTVMTARRLSLPATAVADEFFPATRSPLKRKSMGQPQAGSPLQTGENSVYASRKITRSEPNTQLNPPRRTPKKVRQEDAGSARCRTPGRASRPTTLPSSRAERLTPRRAERPTAALVASLEDEARMTPRRATVRQATPLRLASGRAGSPPVAARISSAEYEERMTPRRALSRQVTSSPYHSERAADSNLTQSNRTPRRRRRSSFLQMEKDEAAVISNRVATESPLFARPAKRARTTFKPSRPPPSHRDILALGTPKRSHNAMPRWQLQDSSDSVLPANGGDTLCRLAHTGTLGTDENSAFKSSDSSHGFTTPSRNAVEPVVERQCEASERAMVTELLPKNIEPEETEGELEVGTFTPQNRANLSDEAENQGSDSSLEEVQLTARKVDVRRLSETSEACAVSEENNESLPLTVRADETGQSTPKTTPKSGMLKIPQLHLNSGARAGSAGKSRRFSVPRRPQITSVVQHLALQNSGAEDGNSPETRHAGVTPAARLQTMSRQEAIQKPAATEARIRTKPFLDHTPEKQVRSASAIKNCLSQKPRSAICKSARKGKGRRKSSTLRKTVLFADTLGADIELTPGPHYSPPPKPRGSPRHERVQPRPDFDNDLPCASPSEPANETSAKQLPRPSPGIDEIAAGPSNQIVTGPSQSDHVLGPPPSTPLGRLGLFFYPTRPAYPLLTYGNVDTHEEPSPSVKNEESSPPAKSEVSSPPAKTEETSPSANRNIASPGSPGSPDDSSSYDGSANPVALPFTEEDADGVDVSTPRRRSLLGGIASLGSYAAGSVLRRLSGPSTVEADDQAALSSSAVPFVATCRNESEFKQEDTQGLALDTEVEMATQELKESEMEQRHGSDSEESIGKDAAGGKESDAGYTGLAEPSETPTERPAVDLVSGVATATTAATPRRQSLIGRGMKYLFGGSAKKEEVAQQGVDLAARESRESETAPPLELAPEEDLRSPTQATPMSNTDETRDTLPNAIDAEHIDEQRSLTDEGQAESEKVTCETCVGGASHSSPSVLKSADMTGAGIPSLDVASTTNDDSTSRMDSSPDGDENCEDTEATFSSWTVKELREYLSGLGYSFHGLRKPELIRLAAKASQPSTTSEEFEIRHDSAGDALDTTADAEPLDVQVLEFSKLTVAELRERLTSLGLDSTGRKSQLVTRLEEAFSDKDVAIPGANRPETDAVTFSSESQADLNRTTSEQADEKYMSMTVKDLRAVLTQRDLCSTGLKKVLIQRLLEDDENSAADTSSDVKEGESVSPEVEERDVETMTVVQLRAALAAADLDTTGRKAELQQRLREALPSYAGGEDKAENEDASADDSWKSKDATKMTVAQLRDVLASKAMCIVGNKARLVQKVKTLQDDSTRVTRRNGGRDLLICHSCEQGKACEASG